MKKNVFIKKINTVVTGVNVVSVSNSCIHFRMDIKQYEQIEDRLISIGANIQFVLDNMASILICKSDSDYSFIKEGNNSTYDNVCNSINNLEYIKENNNILFGNAWISTTEKMAADYISLALEYLTRAKECLRDLHYDR